jgi:hypothetical protein
MGTPSQVVPLSVLVACLLELLVVPGCVGERFSDVCLYQYLRVVV